MILGSIYDQVSEVTVNQQPIILKGNLLRLGLHQDIRYDETSRVLFIEDGKLFGTYASPMMKTTSFSRLIASWNAITPKDTTVEIQVRVEVNGKWSSFFTYGKWGLSQSNASVFQEDELTSFSVDTLTVKGQKAQRVQVLAHLERAPHAQSPMLKLIGLTLDTEQMVFHNNVHLEEIRLAVPPKSQQLIPKIGHRICSPTSVAMVLNYKGNPITPEEVAQLVKDHGADLYGNWSYNVAVAGALGHEAYVAYMSLEDVKSLLKSGHPIVASVTVKEESELDHLPKKADGTSITYPDGHLLVITGLGKHDGRHVVYVNDPAASSDEQVARYYDLQQFMNVWKRVGYVIK